MESRLFEDQQSPDTDRQVSGIGPGAKNPGTPGTRPVFPHIDESRDAIAKPRGLPILKFRQVYHGISTFLCAQKQDMFHGYLDFPMRLL